MSARDLATKKDVTIEELLELVNAYDYSELTVIRNENTIMSMGINAFSSYGGKTYELTQKCNSTRYVIDSADIESHSCKMLDGMDTLLIEIMMKDNFRICICVYHVDTNQKHENVEPYYESDVWSLYDYLNDENHTPLMLIIHDAFGMETRINKLAHCTLSENDGSFVMQMNDGCGVSIEFPLVDDSCNEIYIKEGTNTDTIMIRTYGQPFAEVMILVEKH